MADWSQLPTELLELIANRLNSDFYLLRFRSVCSTWRSSTTFPNPNPNNHHLLNLPSELPYFPPLLDDSPNKPKTLSLSKRPLFLIFPPPQNQTPNQDCPWLIKIENSNNRLLYPLSHYRSLSRSFPPVLDFYDSTVLDLGHEISYHEFNSFPPYSPHGKIVVCQTEQGFVLLSVPKGHLAVFRSGDNRWTTTSKGCTYRDVCVFKGKPIVVDSQSNAFRVSIGVGIEPELEFELVAENQYINTVVDEKYLLESNGELLLVDRYLPSDLWFAAYRLDEKEKRWEKLTSLGDRTLFLGDDCAFSLLASDLGSVNSKNSVVFWDEHDFFKRDYTGVCIINLRS